MSAGTDGALEEAAFALLYPIVAVLTLEELDRRANRMHNMLPLARRQAIARRAWEIHLDGAGPQLPAPPPRPVFGPVDFAEPPRAAPLPSPGAPVNVTMQVRLRAERVPGKFGRCRFTLEWETERRTARPLLDALVELLSGGRPGAPGAG